MKAQNLHSHKKNCIKRHNNSDYCKYIHKGKKHAKHKLAQISSISKLNKKGLLDTCFAKIICCQHIKKQT